MPKPKKQIPCRSCDSSGLVSGGVVRDNYHIPSTCRDCFGIGRVDAGHAWIETRPKLRGGKDVLAVQD